MNFNTISQKIKEIAPENLKQLSKHQGFKRYSKNTGWMFFGQIFSLLISFFIGAWIARYLGPENYGKISYILAFAGIFAFISDLGVSNIISREIIKNPSQKNIILGTGFRLRIIGGLIACFLTTISSLFINTEPLIKILIMFYSIIFILQISNVIVSFFQAEAKIKYVTYAQTIATIISAILKISLIIFHGGIIWLTLIYVLDLIWQGLGYIYYYKRQNFKISEWKYDKKLAKIFWRDSWPLMLSSAAAFIYIRIDQVMIGQMLNNSTVGIYAAAVKISEIIYFIPGVICTSLFPAIVNAKKTDEKIYKKRLQHLYWLMLISAIIISLPISLLSKFIIQILFGADYSQAAPILTIYTWSSIGLFLGTAINQYLMTENMTRFIFIINLIAMIINMGLNFILIPKIGMSGAAVATLVSYLIIPISAWLIIKKKKTY